MDTPESAPIPFQVLANRPKHMRSRGGKGVGFSQDARDGMQSVAPLFGPPALGDVFARNQDDRITARPPHSLGVFTNPDRRAILADFSDLPAMRTAEVF